MWWAEGLGALAVGLVAALSLVGGTATPVAAVIAGLAAAGLYVLRRGLPGVVLAVSAVCGTAVGGMALVQVCAAWSAGRRLRRTRAAVVAFASAFAAVLGAWWWRQAGQWTATAIVLVAAARYFVLVGLPGLFGRYQAQRRSLLGVLQDRHDQLLRERTMVAGQARLRERYRIARDMHDSLGHQLTLLAVQSGALETDRTLGGEHRVAVGAVRRTAVAALEELRQVVGVLREEGEDVGTGGAADIETLVAASQQVGGEVEFRRTGAVRDLAAVTGHAAYRIVQEALTNAYKHAPGTTVEVALHYDPDVLVVEVVNSSPDSGTCAASVSGGQGLAGLRERARVAGGMVHAGPVPDGGFRVAGVLPYEVGGARGLGAPADGDPPLAEPPLPGDGSASMSSERLRAFGWLLAATVTATVAAVMVTALFVSL